MLGDRPRQVSLIRLICFNFALHHYFTHFLLTSCYGEGKGLGFVGFTCFVDWYFGICYRHTNWFGVGAYFDKITFVILKYVQVAMYDITLRINLCAISGFNCKWRYSYIFQFYRNSKKNCPWLNVPDISNITQFL